MGQEGYGGIVLRLGEDDQMHTLHMSRKTTPPKLNYTSYEWEVLIVSNFKAFEQTIQKRELSIRVARWAILLS